MKLTTRYEVNYRTNESKERSGSWYRSGRLYETILEAKKYAKTIGRAGSIGGMVYVPASKGVETRIVKLEREVVS